MTSVPTHYPNRNSLRRQSKNQQRNPWKATSATGSYPPDYQASGYSGNSDTLSSGSRKYTGHNHTAATLQKYGTTGQVVCHQPEPAYENVIGGAGTATGRLCLSRYVSSVVPTSHTAPHKSYHHHHHQGVSTTLSRANGGLGVSAPLIELTPGSRGSTTSPEVANIYDVIEEKSSRGGRVASRSNPGMTLHYNTRPMTPASVKTCASETGVYACGGHCLPFERVCDKILRVVYGIGVLVGIGLLLAGMNGHPYRQNTLMYIGLMTFCVCCLLLWIQCRHYAHRRRHHYMRRPTHRITTHPVPCASNTMIPLAHFNTTARGGGATYMTGTGVNYMPGPAPLLLSHENPLLHRYIEQQSSYTPPPVSELETHATSSLYA